MMSVEPKNPLVNNALAVVAGLLTAVAIICPTFFLGMLGLFSDEHISTRSTVFAFTLIYGGLAVGGFMGGYITSSIAPSWRLQLGLLTGAIVITLPMLIYPDFYFFVQELRDVIVPLLFMLFTAAGSIVAIRKKREDTQPSPPDIL